MAHSGETMDLVFHDPNGNPQIFKVQKAQTVKGPGKSDTIKILTQKPAQLTQVVNASTGTIIPGTTPVLRTVTIQGKQRQYVTIPVTSQIQGLIKQGAVPNSHTTKTIQLPTQSVVVQTQPKTTYIAPILDPNVSRKRKESENGDYTPDFSTSVKRRKSDKGGKGLRHFSMKVCEKVKKKGTTSYNEVADELVSEFTNPNLIPNSVDQQYDQKNIRRRVYDALNVLMAMNIIAKEKKEIRWLGLPTTSAQECGSLLNEKKQISERIKAKTQQLYELLLQQILYKNLVQRNFELEKTRGPPLPNSAIHLPFIVVNSNRQTEIDCSINNEKTEYLFVFNDKFEVSDDFEILKKIGLSDGLDTGTISEENLAKVKSMLPKSMEKYINKMALESTANVNGFKEEESSIFVDELTDCAGPSASDFFHNEEMEEEETSDDESNISTDLETCPT